MFFQNTESFISRSVVGCAFDFNLILIALLLSKLNKSEQNDYGF